jgi:hypothetical protein
MKALFCEHPNKPLRGGYCSYYSEMYHALKEVFDIDFKNFIPRKTSEFDGYDLVFLGFGHTDCSEGKPASLIRDSDVGLFPILNKEYTGLNNKLNWIKEMDANGALTVHHDIDYYSEYTGIPFHRIMWSANQKVFKDYGEGYSSDLFFSGVTRPEQTENLRERVLSDMSRLSNYRLEINARSHRNNYAGTVYSDEEYAKKLASSKICFITTGPSDLVGTRYFEVMSGNKSLILCNEMDKNVYGDMLIDGYNCIMFSTVDEFYDKAEYYLNNEEERVKIVNTAYQYFIEKQTWSERAKQVRKIIEGYVE